MASAGNIGYFYYEINYFRNVHSIYGTVTVLDFSFLLEFSSWKNVLTILSQLGENAVIHFGMCHATGEYSHVTNSAQLF